MLDTEAIVAMITIVVPAFLAAVATPIVVAVVQAKARRLEAAITVENRRLEKEEEWQRADLLESRATERAAEVARRAEETSALLVKATIDVRDLATVIDGKVDEVHVLTNSSYTAALQATYEAVQAKLVVLLGNVAFRKSNKMEVDSETLTDIAATKKKMGELSAAINERLRQDVLAKEAKATAILVGNQAPQPTKDQPLPVADNRTATATERTAAASERVADAAERSADRK